jgi:hypothetical protein
MLSGHSYLGKIFLEPTRELLAVTQSIPGYSFEVDNTKMSATDDLDNNQEHVLEYSKKFLRSVVKYVAELPPYGIQKIFNFFFKYFIVTCTKFAIF